MRGETMSHVERCVRCGDVADDDGGVIDLVDGMCECCRDHLEWVAVVVSDDVRYGDFDYSLNY